MKKKTKNVGAGRRRAEAEHEAIKAMTNEERLDVIKSLLAAGLERMIEKAQMEDETTEGVA